MTPIRNWLITLLLTGGLLLTFAGAASADPGDGGFSDPTIVTPVLVVHVSAPGTITITSTGPTTSTADPGDGGF